MYEEQSPQALVSIVDDDPSIRDLMERLISSSGLRTKGFASAEEFQLQGDPQSHGCIVLDIRMPGRSGLELQSDLNRNGFHVPIIFITAFADVPVAVAAMKAGAVACLTKPFQ